MMHHGVKTVKERVMGVGFCVLVSLGTGSLHAMDEDFKKPEAGNTQVQTTGGFADWLKGWLDVPESNQAPKPQVDQVPAVPVELPEAAQTLLLQPPAEEAQVEVAPKIIRSETIAINNNSIESIQVQGNTASSSTVVVEKQSQEGTNITSLQAPLSKEQDSIQKQSVPAESFWKNITFQGLAQNEKVLYGVGAVGVLTIGTVCYVLYKKGVFKKLCVSMKKHPWCTVAVTGVAALSAAAGALYLSGADKELVLNFFDGIKAQVQKVPGAIKNSLPTFGRQEKAA